VTVWPGKIVNGRPLVGVTTDTAGVVQPVTEPVPAAMVETLTVVVVFEFVTLTTSDALPLASLLGNSLLVVDAATAVVVSN
jgi:hypothetical protein